MSFLIMGKVQGNKAAIIIAGSMAIAVMGIGQGLRTISPWLRISNGEAKGEISTLVVQQIRAVSELTTTIFAMETVVPTSQERQWGNFTLGRTDLLYIGYGEVRAGIDLAQMNERSIQQKDETLKSPPLPVTKAF
ncbi:DUF4230 domain-containing protein [Synechocystis salina]|uniref:DUF4230 domain-containing protein n=1 Tax=Synechocystis salina TaxID=945780 RepID=UPI001D15A800|nr:DUF4230 domain-containing protein [Synechocystis salina]